VVINTEFSPRANRIWSNLLGYASRRRRSPSHACDSIASESMTNSRSPAPGSSRKGNTAGATATFGQHGSRFPLMLVDTVTPCSRGRGYFTYIDGDTCGKSSRYPTHQSHLVHQILRARELLTSYLGFRPRNLIPATASFTWFRARHR